MANRSLFGSLVERFASRPVVRNEAGGRAYARTSAEALAQYVATGCFNATFYAGADAQLERVLTALQGSRARVPGQGRRLRPRARPDEGHAGAAHGGAGGARRRADGADLPARHRHAAHAADLRADGPFRCHGAPVVRHGFPARDPRLVRPPVRRSGLRGLGRQRPVAGGHRADGAPEAVGAVARGALRLPARPRGRPGGASAGREPVRGVQGRRPGDGTRRAVPDADRPRPGAGRVARDRAARVVADDADEPEHVRAARRLRRGRAG